MKTLRFLAGLFLFALILYVASLTVTDCSTGLLAYDNCLWLRVRERLALPQSRIWRAATLEVVGLGLVAGICLTVRFVFPLRRCRQPSAPDRGTEA